MTIRLNTTVRPITLYPGGDGSALYAARSVEAARGRAAVYGLTDDAQVSAFASDGLEALFSAGLYRSGFASGTTPSAIAGWSFSRASTATAETAPGVVETFGSGVPRLKAGRGLLLESAATNLLLHSQAFDNAAWSAGHDGSASNPTVTANTTTAPDGETTADTITFSLTGSTSGDGSYILQVVSGLTPGAKYPFSAWLKGTAGKQVNLVVGGDSALVTLTTGWVRASLTITAASSSTFALIGVSGSMADPAATVDVWGAQFEAGARASSYIPTTSATATRAADQAAITGQAGRLTQPCTVLADASPADVEGPGLAALTGPSSAYLIAYRLDGAAAGVGSSAIATTADDLRIAFSLGATGYGYAVNGAPGSGVTWDTQPGFTSLYAGHFYAPDQLNGWIRRLVVLPFASTDLEGLTS